MKYVASCVALVLLATPAMAQSVGEKTGVNSTLGIRRFEIDGFERRRKGGIAHRAG
jgi:hypothetical protein